jgi:peptidoglycan-associated lipoprotein
MKSTPHRLSLLALSLAVALSAGCASTPKKPEEASVPTAEATNQDTKPEGAAAGGVQTGAVSNNGGLNSVELGEEGASAGQDGRAATGGTGASGNVSNGGTNSATAEAQAMAAALTVRTVQFDFDSADIRQDDYSVLLAHARYLQQHPQARVMLAGHADERGTREYNMALGERRAKAVEAFFGVNGVRNNQLDTVSYGKEKPVNDGNDETAWAENRRVEIGYEAGEP